MKSFILFIILCFSVTSVFTQEVRLNLYTNYVFDDRVESYYSSTNYFHGTIQGGLLWGGSIDVMANDYTLELLYLRQDTKIPVYYYDINSFGEKNTTLDMNINWIMAGGMQSLAPGKKVDPYGGFLLGMAIINSNNTDNNSTASATKFAWGLRLGSNFWLSDKFGIKVQASLLSAVQAAGGGLYFGTAGSGATITAYSSLVQFSMGGGLVLKLRAGTPHK